MKSNKKGWISIYFTSILYFIIIKYSEFTKNNPTSTSTWKPVLFEKRINFDR